jgi:hypothetical protein
MSSNPLTKLPVQEALPILRKLTLDVQEILDKDEFPDESPIHYYQRLTNFLKNTYDFREEQIMLAQLVNAQKSTPGSNLHTHLRTLLSFVKTVEMDLRNKEQIETSERFQLTAQNLKYQDDDKALRDQITRLREELHKVRQELIVKEHDIVLIEQSKEFTISELKSDLAKTRRELTTVRLLKITAYVIMFTAFTVANLNLKLFIQWYDWPIFGFAEGGILYALNDAYHKESKPIKNILGTAALVIGLVFGYLGVKSSFFEKVVRYIHEKTEITT